MRAPRARVSVLMMYRSGYYDPDFDDPKQTDLYVRKNRNGSTGTVQLSFDRKFVSFSEAVKS